MGGRAVMSEEGTQEQTEHKTEDDEDNSGGRMMVNIDQSSVQYCGSISKIG